MSQSKFTLASALARMCTPTDESREPTYCEKLDAECMAVIKEGVAQLTACVAQHQQSLIDAKRELDASLAAPAPIQSAEVAELRRLAEAATPGEWTTMFDNYVILADHAGRKLGGSTNPTEDYEEFAFKICTTDCKYLSNRANAQYIAAANPAAILRLLDKLAMAERAISHPSEFAWPLKFGPSQASLDLAATPAAPDPLGGIEILEHPTLKRAAFANDQGYALYMAERASREQPADDVSAPTDERPSLPDADTTWYAPFGGAHVKYHSTDQIYAFAQARVARADVRALRQIAEWNEVHRSHQALVRELDVLLNGNAGAAKQASLCDIVAQVRADLAARAAAPVSLQTDEPDAANEWRRLALQFDGHRMAALSHLRMMLQDATTHAPVVETFLSAPPLSGEAVLAERIKAISAAPVSGQGASIHDDPQFHLLITTYMTTLDYWDNDLTNPIVKTAARNLVQFIDSRPRSEDSRAKVLTAQQRWAARDMKTQSDWSLDYFRELEVADIRALATTATPSGPAQEQAVPDGRCTLQEHCRCVGYESDVQEICANWMKGTPAPPSPAVRTLTDAGDQS